MKQDIESGFARVFGAQAALPAAHLVSVECDITRGLHAFTIVGLPDKAVEEAKDRVASAIKNCGEYDFESPKRSNKKIVVSLAPAELKKEGAGFDLPFALCFLLASQQITFDPAEKLFAGELTLDGHLRPIRGALSIAIMARDEGFGELFLPPPHPLSPPLPPPLLSRPDKPYTEGNIQPCPLFFELGWRERDDDLLVTALWRFKIILAAIFNC